MEDLVLAASLSPREAVEFMRARGLDVSWDWHDTWEEAHGRAFVVAKATEMHILDAIKAVVDEAIADGLTRGEFVARLEPTLRRLGWWGRQLVENPDGVSQAVQLGSPWRLRTIYDTNMRVAQAAGRWKRQVANADARPYLIYDAVNDHRTRPAHAALDGLVFVVDDPIWRTHFPPNGFNCRCVTRSLTQRQVDEMGLTVVDSAGRLRRVRQHVGVDRQGRPVEGDATQFRLGRRVMTPDPGWNYNPGASP